MCVWTHVPGAGADRLWNASSTMAPAWKARLWARGKGWMSPACSSRALLLAQEHSHFPIPGKEHNVHWLLSRLMSPTPLLPGAARHFLTRTRAAREPNPGAGWGRCTAPRLQECQQQGSPPGAVKAAITGCLPCPVPCRASHRNALIYASLQPWLPGITIFSLWQTRKLRLRLRNLFKMAQAVSGSLLAKAGPAPPM